MILSKKRQTKKLYFQMVLTPEIKRMIRWASNIDIGIQTVDAQPLILQQEGYLTYVCLSSPR